FLDLVGGVGGLVAHDVELAAEQIVHRRPGAAIGNSVHLHAELFHQHHHAKMRGGADAGVPVDGFIAACANPLQKIGNVICSQGRPGHQGHGHVRNATEVVEVVDDIVSDGVVK